MYGKLSITRFFWQLAIFSIFFWCRLMNIFLTQFWTVKLLIHKPQPRPKYCRLNSGNTTSNPNNIEIPKDWGKCHKKGLKMRG